MATGKKQLPIRRFQKRDIDIRDTEGGGGKPPKWVLKDEALLEHAAEISKQFIKSFHDRQIFDDHVFSVPLPIGVQINEKAKAKSHRESIEKVFADENNNVTSVGFSPRNELLFTLKTKEHFKQIDQNLKNPETNNKGVSAIKNINKYKPVVEENIDLKDKLKIKLIPYEDSELRKKLQFSFLNFCKTHSIDIKKCNYSPKLDIYKASNVTQDSFDEIVEFDGIFSIESMPTYEPDSDWIAENREVDLKNFDNNIDYPKVGVLDSGISKIDYLYPWICGEKSPYSEDELDKGHGTFVAGILLYGDDLEGKKLVGCNECRIFDAAVVCDKSLGWTDEDELLDNIREIINEYNDKIKIWSLSLGSKKEASIQSFSEFGIALDKIQDDNSVIIVKSVGNCKNFKKNLPPSRISQSADSIRSIAVGSIAHRQRQADISKFNHISPFSRIGPGPLNMIKPDLVHYGGNSGLSGDGECINSGVYSFSVDGNIVSGCGTSFSTPRVSALVANLNHNLMGDFDDLLIKTLLIHSSKYPQEVQEPVEEKKKKYGYGIPPDLDNIMMNSPNEITLLLQDNLTKGHFIEILDFPFPESLVNNTGYYDAEIIVTLVYKQLLDETQNTEYCQSDLNVAFGTYDNITARDTNKPIIKNPIGKVNSQNILKETLYSKKKGKNIFPLSEPIFIQKVEFHPIKKFHCNLSKMTEGNKRYITSDKKWFLNLTGSYRYKAERDANKSGTELSQKFCLAITIKANSKSHDVYNQVFQLLDQRNFLHQGINIRSDIRV